MKAVSLSIVGIGRVESRFRMMAKIKIKLIWVLLKPLPKHPHKFITEKQEVLRNSPGMMTLEFISTLKKSLKKTNVTNQLPKENMTTKAPTISALSVTRTSSSSKNALNPSTLPPATSIPNDQPQPNGT
jgi:hypothetical protein